MNLFGSYKALLGNSHSAMLAAIELYNKPSFAYRSECFVILVLNAWELLFKAILSKQRVRIFRPKERGRQYMTLDLFEAANAAAQHFPGELPYRAIAGNVEALVNYRNNAVHFYNEQGFEVVIYGLAQTSIVNYREVADHFFGVDIAEDVNIALLPLSFAAPPDPIAFIGKRGFEKPAIAQFLAIISATTKELEDAAIDTGRFLTVFRTHLQSTKKVASADFVVGIARDLADGPLMIDRKVDPNISHPHLRKAVVQLIGPGLRGVKFTGHTFDAIVWHRKIKGEPRYCWHSKNTNTFHYSNDLIPYIKGQSLEEINAALKAYRDRKAIPPENAV